MKKTLFVLGAVFIVFLLAAPLAKAMTAEELNVKIAELQAQIAALQVQLTQLQGQQSVWCHNFYVNLRYDNKGEDVFSLQKALKSEGLLADFDKDEMGEPYFGEYTASAVSGFQEKYKSEILTPLGLKYATGYVGSSTRAKLNQLYGCVISPAVKIPVYTISVYKELSLIRGNAYYFTGKVTNGLTNSRIFFYLQSPDGKMEYNGLSNWPPEESCRSTGCPFAITDPGGNFEYSIQATIPSNAQSGSWVSWVTVGGIQSNKLYHNVVVSPSDPPICIQVLAPAKNSVTGECRVFPTPCDVPAGWTKVSSCPVITPSITVVSPNGGEVWRSGETRQIRWNSTGVASVRIYLYDSNISGSGSTNYVTPNNDPITANLGYYNWTIPALNQLPGGGGNNYRIRVVKMGDVISIGDDANLQDVSDLPFSIVSANGFSDLSADLGSGTAAFRFNNQGVLSNGYSIDVSTLPDMSWDVYVNFGSGGQNAISVANPKTRWDKYTCGRTLYWRVNNYDRTVSSSIQVAVVDCSSKANLTVLNGLKFYKNPHPDGEPAEYEIKAEDLNKYLGQLVTAKAVITNTGSAGTGVFNVKWLLDGNQMGYGSQPGLLPGEKGNGLFCDFVVDSGSHKIEFRVDADNYVLEINENDNNFSVIFWAAPSITVVSPNGGETLKIKETYNISWKLNGFDSSTLPSWIGVQLWNEAGQVGEIYSGAIKDAAESYNWTIEKAYQKGGAYINIQPGKYRLYVSTVTGNYVTDFSDNYFSIVE